MEADMHIIFFIASLMAGTDQPTLTLHGAFDTYEECKSVLKMVDLPSDVKSRMSCVAMVMNPEEIKKRM